MDVVGIIKLARQSAGLTQGDLARISGIPQPNIARIESGRRQPTLATATRLLGALGLTLSVAPLPVDAPSTARSLARHRRLAAIVAADPEGPIVIEARARLEAWKQEPARRRAGRWIELWEHLLWGDPTRLIAAMGDPSSDGADLRQASPFVGPAARAADAA